MPEIDEDFLCGHCGKQLVPTGEKINNLQVFSCQNCAIGFQVECPVCHKPRTLWAKRFNLCFICSKNLTKH